MTPIAVGPIPAGQMGRREALEAKAAERGVAVPDHEDYNTWRNVTDFAVGCERGTLSRLLNGRAGVSANMALALEDIGWGTAEHWMRMKASYELAQARRERVAAERCTGALHA